MGQRDIKHFLEGERRVDRRSDGEQQARPVAGTTLVRQRRLQLAGGSALPHEGHREQEESYDEEDRNDKQDCREIQRLPPGWAEVAIG